jgi:hypothetical protein
MGQPVARELHSLSEIRRRAHAEVVGDRGDAYGPEVLYVRGGLVVIILLSLWFTRGPGTRRPWTTA